MSDKFNSARAKAHGYTKGYWDAVSSPELSDDKLATAQPFEQACPELGQRFNKAISNRDACALDTPKIAVSMHLDRDLVDIMRAGGRGWQARANALLRKGMGL